MGNRMNKKWLDFWNKHQKKKVRVKLKSGKIINGKLRQFNVSHGNILVDVDEGYDGKPKHIFIRDDYSYFEIERGEKKKGEVYLIKRKGN